MASAVHKEVVGIAHPGPNPNGRVPGHAILTMNAEEQPSAAISVKSGRRRDQVKSAAPRSVGSTPRWYDFSYPSQPGPHGVFERGLTRSTRAIVAPYVAAVENVLKVGDRDMLSDCLFATANWSRVLAAGGATVRVVGGVGQHLETVPATPSERQGGYLTDDDGLVQHWWLMLEPHGLIFDPTAHQFDGRGGVDIDRYRVEGTPVAEWRRDWPARASGFPIVAIGSRGQTSRTRLGLRGGR
jgi:hypothetical protein